MSGLFTTLSRTASALSAQQYALDITGQNIANINTDGYARRRVQFAETPAIDAENPGGVEVLGAQAQRDTMLEARLRAELPAGQMEGAIADSLNVVQSSLGDTGSSIDGQLTAFFDSYSALADDPTSTIARDGVLQQGRQLASSFNDLAARFAQARSAADTQVRSTVEQINTLTTQIASLNAAMGATTADVPSLQDQQNVALTALAKLANITVMARSDGPGVDVTMGSGRALVVGAKPYALGIGSGGIGGMATVTAGGVDVTKEIASGALGGLLQVRDSIVPGYQTQLDALASAVANEVNARHAAGYNATGNTNQNFFVVPPAGGAGAAAAFAVDPAIVNDSTLIAASKSGTSGDNQTAKDIADLRTTPVLGGATLVDAWSQLVFKVGSDVQAATTNRQIHQDVATAVQSLRDGISGVSLDEEAASMLKFQRAYEANARFFTTVDAVIDNLLTMVT